MIKDEMSAVVSNPKLRMSSSKISPDVIERFSILTIENEYARSVLILQSIFKASASNIGIPNNFFCLELENSDTNNKNNENEAKTRIELEDKIN